MSDGEQAFEDAFAVGRANQVTIELARRHCLNMTFTAWGGSGHGLAEATSELPIGRRQVSCPMARSNPANTTIRCGLGCAEAPTPRSEGFPPAGSEDRDPLGLR